MCALQSVVFRLHHSVEYRKEVLYPVLSSAARRAGQSSLFRGMVYSDQPLTTPPGVSEFEVRLKQVGACCCRWVWEAEWGTACEARSGERRDSGVSFVSIVEPTQGISCDVQ